MVNHKALAVNVELSKIVVQMLVAVLTFVIIECVVTGNIVRSSEVCDQQESA